MANKPIDVFLSVDMTGGLDSCWPWKKSLNKGRPYFTVHGEKWLAYRLIYTMLKGPIADNLVVRHMCDNGKCCNPAHLELGTQQENMNDMTSHERHGLPHHVVKAIRNLLAAGRTHQSIADLYGISREAVTHINNGRAYGHLAKGENDE